MPDFHILLLFVVPALLLLLTPGPAVTFVVTRSLQRGRPAGMISALGLACGALVHVAATVLGLGAILAASAVAFSTVKLAGAAYLIWLGIKALRAGRSAQPSLEPQTPVKARRNFVDGFVVNLLNPKLAVFFLAFLPQFVDPAGGAVRAQLALLGLTFVSLAVVTDSLYAIAAASVRGWLMRHKRLFDYQHYLSAATYFGLGLTAALTGRRPD